MSLAVRDSSGRKGRELHTTTARPAATRLATYPNPVLALPTTPATRTTCASCLRTDFDTPVTPCSACRAAYYCSKACQRLSWNRVHRQECPALRAVPAGRELPTPVRALLQVVVRKDAWHEVSRLEGNEGGFRAEAGRWGDLRLQGEMVRRVLGRDPEWVGGGDVVGKYAAAMCKLLTNMFNVHDPDFNYDAVFLDTSLAMANHSCVPNASVHIYGRTAILVSDRAIAKDEEITISYTNPSYPLAQRRQDLAKYHFECTCPRCADDLSPYAAAALHPLPEMDSFSLARLPHDKVPSVPGGTSLQAEIYEKLAPLQGDPTRARLRQEYRICEPLIGFGQWASLAPFLEECLGYYLTRGPVEALLITALSACRAHPITHTPFSPYRLKGALAVVRALSSATADPAHYKSRIASIADTTGAAGAVDVDLLIDVDPIAMSRMVLYMINFYLPVTQEESWPLAVQARQALAEIKEYSSWGEGGAREGMERWEGGERDAEWMAVWRRMVGLVDGFAELGARLIVADFGA
ncbi:uncharacterized protein DNG_06937 [Cephalotrichum gorgonifer]|uniref:Suppressor of anucleate metulae protein B n=1 Tax=Cephalotrichum gorgonifer TaxID=2041049 RepID=A0AAE8N2I4_9PEZI|nr:uncharacterized protein DNG_06937 [Cephalotrichum gorgonifer]